MYRILFTDYSVKNLYLYVPMNEDSGFFAVPGAADTLSAAPELIHTSAEGWTELWRVEKDGRFVVLKALRPAYRGQLRYESLLRKEFEISRELDHPAIRAVHGFVNHPDLGSAIEMEWIDGDSLQTILQGKRLPKATAREILLQVCDALSYIHARQIVHRDIKPANILITRNGGNVKLIDFGLSDADAYAIHKSPAGTLSFASPELINGGEVDLRTDIYSLGKVIALILPSAKGLIRKCVRPEKEGRYAHAVDVRTALAHKSPVMPIIFAAAAAVAAAIILLLPKDSPQPQPVPAETTVSDPAAIDEIFRQATEMIDNQ